MLAVRSTLFGNLSPALRLIACGTATLADAYEMLKLNPDCTRLDARNAFISRAKEYHPDSGSPTADGDKFAEYSIAFKLVIKDLKTKESGDILDMVELEEEEYSIEDILKETIPIAHRKYLTNDGIGFGTPGQRQRQYQAYRMNRASSMVADYKIQKLQRETEGSNMLTVKQFAKRSKTSHFVDRVVEDLIQESMAKGELNGLKGGKIEIVNLPHVDRHDYHLNRVLINNGYVPEWVQAKQDIEKSREEARKGLLKEKIRFHAPPHSTASRKRWGEKYSEFLESIATLNKDIQAFNLITPLPKTQMLLLVAEKELEVVEEMYGKHLEKEKCREDESKNVSDFESTNPLVLAIKKILSF